MAATTSTPGGVSSQTVSPPAGDGFRRPSIDTSVPALNAQPVELDSTPIESPTTQRNTANAKDPAKGGIVSSPDEVQLGYENVSGIKGANAQEREKRTELLSQRSKDPAVLVDIPQTPDAVDYEVAQKGVGLR